MLNSAATHVPLAHSDVVAQSWRPSHAVFVGSHTLAATFERVTGHVLPSSVEVVRQHGLPAQWRLVLQFHVVSFASVHASQAFTPNFEQQGVPVAQEPLPTPGQTGPAGSTGTATTHALPESPGVALASAVEPASAVDAGGGVAASIASGSLRHSPPMHCRPPLQVAFG